MMDEEPNMPKTSYSPKHHIIYTRARMRDKNLILQQHHTQRHTPFHHKTQTIIHKFYLTLVFQQASNR